MNEIAISKKISYIPCSEDPLSADIGIIREKETVWLYDVGNGERSISGLKDSYHIVLSHFHQDHVGNLGKFRAEKLHVSRETYRHIRQGTIVDSEFSIGNLHIFPLPSSHAKGCLGLEIDGKYAFVGDALYGKMKGDCCVYNAQLLKEQIAALKRLQAPYLLVSHVPGLVREKDAVIAELEAIYETREHNNAMILVKK